MNTPHTDCEKCNINELEGQVQALNDLIGVAQASVSSIDLDTLLSAILESAMSYAGMPAGSVALYDNRTGLLTLRAHAGLSPEFVARDSWVVTPGGLTDQLLRHDEILFVEDTELTDFFNNPCDMTEPVTVSIGISSYPRDAADGNALVAVADRLLYQAKGAGKNRILVREGNDQ